MFWGAAFERSSLYQASINGYFGSPLSGDPISAAAFATLNNSNFKAKFSSIRTPSNGVQNINGITHPYLYAGGFGTFTEFYTEDMDLLSMNLLCGGTGKIWYGISRS